MTKSIDAILTFWFGTLNEQGLCAPEQHALWFKSSDKTDQLCRENFEALVHQAIAGQLDHWETSDRGVIALIILLDQFTRNIFRGTPQAFIGDQHALDIAQRVIAAGRHLQLPAIHRVFLYLPLEHSESLPVQEQCIELFAQLRGAQEGAVQQGAVQQGAVQQAFTGFERYAIAHRDVIAQFGRFPHRNTILGRVSTEAELEYLKTHGGF
ncbi:MAG: DUF924 family protein [Halioglobus sp.]